MTTPLRYQWDGEAMKVLPRFQRQADRQFVVGEVYTLAADWERSRRSHNHYFACINHAWLNLPERIAPRFPSPEHLRKWDLISTGYADMRETVCDTPDAARRIAAFIRPMDAYAVVEVVGNAVRIWTAQSQSLQAMKKKTFQESKDAVLGILSDLVAVERAVLANEASLVPEGVTQRNAMVPDHYREAVRT